MESQYLDEIASFLIEGAYKWYNGGRIFRKPESCMKALEEYLTELDSLQRFLNDHTEKAMNVHTPVADFFQRYINYCNGEINEIGLSKNDLNKRMEKMDYVSKDARVNGQVVKCWISIRFKT